MTDPSESALAATLQALRVALAPTVEELVAEAARGGRLAEQDAHRFAGDPALRSRPISQWPLAPLLRLVFLAWNVAFGGSLDAGIRSAVSALRTTVDAVERGAPIGISERVKAEQQARLVIERVETRTAPPAEGGSAAGSMSNEMQDDAATRDRTIAPTTGSAESPRTVAPKADRPFKIICWLKHEEARILAEAHRLERDQETTTAKGMHVVAKWYGPAHEDAQRFRSDVCLLRFGRDKSRHPKSHWIRPEEAEAVLAAYETHETVEFSPRGHGKGGQAVFHPDSSDDAQRYFANVMLTRFR